VLLLLHYTTVAPLDRNANDEQTLALERMIPPRH
jgi:hypothetical protein